MFIFPSFSESEYYNQSIQTPKKYFIESSHELEKQQITVVERERS
jgi:hypothetical protein